MFNKYKIQIILCVISFINYDLIWAQIKTESSPKDSDYENRRRDFNRILGDIAYNDDYEMHWGLAVVAVLPLIAILIALLIWKFCKTGQNGHNSETGRDVNNKRSFSHEESSY